MICDVKLNYSSKLDNTLELEFKGSSFKREIVIRPDDSGSCIVEHLELELEFESEIRLWRDFDYQWRSANRPLLANYYSPKGITLDNGYKVMAGQTKGVWEFNPAMPKKLIWIISNSWLKPLCEYDKHNNTIWRESELFVKSPIYLSLLYTKEKLIEFSRSKIPFTAVLSFTDHCDFDTLPLVKKQRELFRKNNIVTTKGIFPNHFSKRKSNTSWEFNQDEYKLWQKDGHELCYHSLTQSLKRKRKIGISDFTHFPKNKGKFTTWIDHGFQPYNLTKYRCSGIKEDIWSNKMNRLGIKNFWNYLDTGTSGGSIINQVDYNSFSLYNYTQASKRMSFMEGTYFLIRCYHLYFASDRSNKSYLFFVKELKNRSFKKGLVGMLHFLNASLGFSWSLLFMFLKILLAIIHWPQIKNKVAPWAKYAPIIFSVDISGRTFNVFQTLEIHDFVKTFSIENVNNLIEQNGVCIAHTYFASLDSKQKGRMFKNALGEYSNNIEYVFSNLKSMSDDYKIWIASISDIAEYFSLFNLIEFDIDKQGHIFLKSKNSEGLHFRFFK